MQPEETPSTTNRKQVSLLRVIVVTAFLATLGIGALAGWTALPSGARFLISDFVLRPFSPAFEWPPDSMTAATQESVIGEYKRRGYRLTCYGGLNPDERIAKDDDYLCWSRIKSAYDNIPANLVTFFFSKGELRHVRVELPEESHQALQNYLSKKLVRSVRLEGQQLMRFGMDIYGKPMMVWIVEEGIVITSQSATRGKPVTLLWSSKKARA